MNKELWTVPALIGSLLILLLSFGCCIGGPNGNVRGDKKSGKTGGIANTFLYVYSTEPEIIEQTETSVTCMFGFCDIAENDPYVIIAQILTPSMLNTSITRAAIVQLPADATEISGTYDDHEYNNGSLNILSGLSAVPVGPGQVLPAEAGHQLIVVDFPISTKNEKQVWFQTDLSFRVSAVEETALKSIITAKVVIDGGSPYYLPLCPAVADFASVPAVTLPVAAEIVPLEVPLPTDLPNHGGSVVFDLTGSGTGFPLYFPRLSFVPGESTEGFGFMNPGQNDAQVTFEAYNSQGILIGMSNPIEWIAGGQGAFQAEGLLGLNQETSAWVKAQVDQPDLVGFYLSQMYGPGTLSGLDGAGVFTDGMTEGIISRVQGTGGYTTELFIANTGVTSADVTVTGYDGVNSVAGGVHTIPPKGVLISDLTSLFGAKAIFDGYIHLAATREVIANATIKFGSEALSSLNAVPVSEASANLYAAHITATQDLYYTTVNLVNPGVSDTTATITPYNADGTAMGDSFEVIVPANQLVTLQGTELGLPDGINSDGWLKVETSGQPILGCLTFANPVDNHYESTLPLQSQGARETYYAQVANGTVGAIDYFTGVAVINTSAAPVQISISVHLCDGSRNGNLVTRTLQPGEKYVRLLSTLEGIGSLAHQSSGYLHISADAPVFSFLLFGNNDGDFLSAVTTAGE